MQQVVIDPDAMALLDEYIGDEKAKLADPPSPKQKSKPQRPRDITKRKFVSDLIRKALKHKDTE